MPAICRYTDRVRLSPFVVVIDIEIRYSNESVPPDKRSITAVAVPPVPACMAVETTVRAGDVSLTHDTAVDAIVAIVSPTCIGPVKSTVQSLMSVAFFGHGKFGTPTKPDIRIL